MKKALEPGMPAASAIEIGALVDYQQDSIVSRTLVKHNGGTLTCSPSMKGRRFRNTPHRSTPSSRCLMERLNW